MANKKQVNSIFRFLLWDDIKADNELSEMNKAGVKFESRGYISPKLSWDFLQLFTRTK